MDAGNSGIIEAFIKDPVERPVGVVMWQVLTFPDGKKVYVGGKEMSAADNLYLLRLWKAKDSTQFVTLPLRIDDKHIRVRLIDLLGILEQHA
jgi:hypothetical protein